MSSGPLTVLLVARRQAGKFAVDLVEQSKALCAQHGLDCVADWNGNEARKIKDKKVALAVSLGGDGTVLRTAQILTSQVQASQSNVVLPPIAAFSAGNLGFLTEFPWKELLPRLAQWLPEVAKMNDLNENSSDAEHAACRHAKHKGFLSLTRCGLRPKALFKVVHEVGSRTGVNQSLGGISSTEERPTGPSSLNETRYVLNDLVLNSGTFKQPSAFHDVDCWVNGKRAAAFQADGLIVATPSGSAAYSLAAGGSLVAPTVDAMLLTAIAPHMLSARPIVIPGSSVVRLEVGKRARGNPRVIYDGHFVHELEDTGRLTVQRAPFDLWFVSRSTSKSSTNDWINALRRKLRWSESFRYNQVVKDV